MQKYRCCKVFEKKRKARGGNWKFDPKQKLERQKVSQPAILFRGGLRILRKISSGNLSPILSQPRVAFQFTHVFLALLVPTLLGLGFVTLLLFPPPLFLASFSFLTLSSANSFNLTESFLMSTSLRGSESSLIKWGAKCLSNPGLVDCFFKISLKREVEKDSQSSFEEGFVDLNLERGSSAIFYTSGREKREWWERVK